jgi:hypothetical protein
MAPFDDNQLHTGELTWPERIENYRREIKHPAFLTIEDNWVHGVWLSGYGPRPSSVSGDQPTIASAV